MRDDELFKRRRSDAIYQLMAEKNYFSKEGIEAAIDWASRKQKTELLSILMNEQHKRFPKKKKTFEL